LFGHTARIELDQHSLIIEMVASSYKIDPNLIRGVILNEAITRYGAGVPEAVVSRIRQEFGGFGTYGPAQLGRPAREAVGLSIMQSLTYPGAIIGAANLLNAERQRLISEGIKNPTNGQIATRYNMGSWDSSEDITKYGKRVEYLIQRYYSDK
jgi:hypothetical protein